MCLNKTHIFPKISRKPIIVYKLFDVKGKGHKNLFTPIMGYCYEIGDIIKASKPWYWGIMVSTISSEGVHAYYSKPIESPDYYICEIPPFTPYWIGKYGDIAASKMKIIKKL